MKYTKEQLKANRKAWCDLACSSEITQAFRQLQDGPNCFCILGCLVEAWSRETGIEPPRSKNGDIGGINETPCFYPQVKAWVGLRTDMGAYTPLPMCWGSLAVDNDMGTSLPKIAQIIRAEPEGLFE